MQFFSVYDLLLQNTLKKKSSIDDMYSFFREHKIKKSSIEALKQTAYIPDAPEFRSAICEYLDMSLLEINLAMGHIPADYRESYFDNVKAIAEILTKDDNKPIPLLKPYFQNDLGSLYNADCLEVLKLIPDSTVDLVFADPPFNLGKKYDEGINDSLTISKYLNWTYDWLDQCVRILKPGGLIFVYNIPKWCIYIASHLDEYLTFWDWIAIDMKYSLPIQKRLYPAHYGLVAFVKGDKVSTFHNQRIPMQVCRHCGGELKDYGGYKKKMNPAGVNVSDVWTDIYPVRHKNSKNRRYNELPVKLLKRVIEMSTNEGDTVFDPFGGSGTTYAVAQLLNRKWIGCELGDCETIKNRLLTPYQDKEQLKKIQEEEGELFTQRVKELRLKNGFWICETLPDEQEEEYSMSLFDIKVSP